MKTILVLGVSGNVSFGILRVLRKNFPHYKIIGSCINKSYADYFCDEFLISPYANEYGFIDWFLNLCNELKIDIVFSGVEEIIEKLVQNKDLIKNNTNCHLTFSDINQLEIGSDKYKTTLWLKTNDFNYPQYLLPNNKEDIFNFFQNLNKPLIIKPLKGKGSKGILTIRSFSELKEINIDFSKYLVQELIGNDEMEFTVGCYRNINNEVLKPIILRRRLHNGHSIYARVVENEIISNYAIEITKKFKPIGPLNVQLRLDDKGNPVCFELNVRFSGTTLIRDFFGFKDVVCMANEKLMNRYDPQCFDAKSQGVCLRIMDEFFFEGAEKSLNRITHYE